MVNFLKSQWIFTLECVIVLSEFKAAVSCQQDMFQEPSVYPQSLDSGKESPRKLSCAYPFSCCMQALLSFYYSQFLFFFFFFFLQPGSSGFIFFKARYLGCISASGLTSSATIRAAQCEVVIKTVRVYYGQSFSVLSELDKYVAAFLSFCS